MSENGRHGNRVAQLALASCLIMVSCLCAIDSVAELPRHLTVRESVEVADFTVDATSEEEQIAKFSPDGRHFIVETTRGLLETNEMESTVWLFDSSSVSDVLNSPATGEQVHPTPIATVATSSVGCASDKERDAITDASWAADGQTIAFLATDRRSECSLYIVRISDGKQQRIALDGQTITTFNHAKDVVVFTATPAVTDSTLYQAGGPALPDIQIGTGQALFSLLFPKWEQVTFGVSPQSLWKVRNGEMVQIINSVTSEPVTLLRGDPISQILSLSPSGHYAVAANNVNHVPQVWETYEAAFSYTRFVSKRNARPVNNLGPAQYVLIDLRSGTISPLVDAPLGWGAGYFWDITKAVWSPDEREVAVSNTFLPLDSALTKQGSYVRRPCVAVVEIASRRGECIKETPPLDGTKLPHPPHLLDFEWCAKGRGLLLRYDNGGDAGSTLITEFDRDRQGWRSVDDPVRKEMRSGTLPNRRLLIARRADINVPPVLTATDSQTGRSKVLWNPNPQLSNFDLGEATVYHWRDRAGHEWTGGLVKPPQYVSGRRYPLVIQTHGFDPNKFLKDGFYPTANAARALASRGIVVLQVAEIRAAAMFTPLEADVNGRSGYESAIEHLAAEGLIDPLKVGIIGFSQTGWYVLDSLIRLPNSFLAATLAETFNVTLGEYLIGADYGSASEETAGAMGAQPFGNGIQRWLSQSPGFNTEKIRTPILFEENNPVTLIYCWDIYAALRLQSKPVELLYMRNGSHVLNRPLQLVASQEINVDWYDFWLNGHEDPDPGKSDQYTRWRELRKLQKSE